MAAIRSFQHFCRLFLQSLIAGKPYWLAGPKYVLLLLLGFWAVADSDKVSVVFQKEYIRSLTMGVLVFSLFVLTWVAFALGSAWAKFVSFIIQFDSRIVPDNPSASPLGHGESRSYRLKVFNDGVGKTMVDVYVNQIKDKDGNDIPSCSNHLPHKLSWHGNYMAGEGPAIAADLPGTLAVFHVGHRGHERRSSPPPLGHEYYLGFAGAFRLFNDTTEEKICEFWLEMMAKAESGHTTKAWFHACPARDGSFRFSVVAETPPFDKPAVSQLWEFLSDAVAALQRLHEAERRWETRFRK